MSELLTRECVGHFPLIHPLPLLRCRTVQYCCFCKYWQNAWGQSVIWAMFIVVQSFQEITLAWVGHSPSPLLHIWMYIWMPTNVFFWFSFKFEEEYPPHCGVEDIYIYRRAITSTYNLLCRCESLARLQYPSRAPCQPHHYHSAFVQILFKNVILRWHIYI